MNPHKSIRLLELDPNIAKASWLLLNRELLTDADNCPLTPFFNVAAREIVPS